MNTKTVPDRKFKATYYVEAYRLSLSGLPDHEIAAALNVTGKTFRKWKRKKPAFTDALQQGRNTIKRQPALEDYLYDRLSPQLRVLFNQLWQLRDKTGGIDKVKELLDDKGVKVRQHLFLHALVKTNNESKALKITCTPKKVYDYWCDKDPEFEALVKEMIWHKQNWIIEQAHEAVDNGSESILLHMLKTFCKDRGYGEKTEVEVKHDHTHLNLHAQLDFEQIAPFLDTDTKRKILGAVEKAQLALPAHEEVIEAEYTVKKEKKDGKRNRG